MTSLCLKSITVAAALMMALTSASHAAVVGVTASTALGPTTTVSWAGLGPDGASVVSPAVVTDGRGNAITVASPSGSSLRRFDEGANFNGNFSFGDALLYVSGGGVLTLGFASSVSGGGLQIQSGSFGDFAATITAYNVGGALLGSFSENGFSDNTEDGSAIFIGLRDTTADIARLTFTVGSGGFAVNGARIVSDVAVPEPSTSLLLVTAALGLAFTRQVLRKANTDDAAA